MYYETIFHYEYINTNNVLSIAVTFHINVSRENNLTGYNPNS